MKNFYIVVLAAVCCLFLAACGGGQADDGANEASTQPPVANNLSDDAIAQRDAELAFEADEVLIGSINGKEYYGFDPEVQTERFNLQGSHYTVEETAEEMLRDYAMLQEGKKLGYEATDEEVDDVIADTKNAVHEAHEEDGYNYFFQMIDAYGWAEDEYWEMIRSAYKERMTIMRYYHALEAEAIEKMSAEGLEDLEIREKLESTVDKKIQKMMEENDVKLLYDKDNKVVKGNAMELFKERGYKTQ